MRNTLALAQTFLYVLPCVMVYLPSDSSKSQRATCLFGVNCNPSPSVNTTSSVLCTSPPVGCMSLMASFTSSTHHNRWRLCFSCLLSYTSRINNPTGGIIQMASIHSHADKSFDNHVYKSFVTVGTPLLGLLFSMFESCCKAHSICERCRGRVGSYLSQPCSSLAPSLRICHNHQAAFVGHLS